MKPTSSPDNLLRLRATSLLALWTVLLTAWITRASAETILIDDFNDGNDDGWTHIDSTAGFPWGPATIDVNGKGEYRFESGAPIGRNIPGGGFMGALWNESTDPQYSDGYVRARVRIGENFDLAGLAMRTTGSLETGLSGYLFGAQSDHVLAGDPPESAPGIMAIRLVINSENVGGVSLGFPLVVDEELMLEAGAVGDQLSLKVWRVGEAEPAEPQLVVPDSTFSTGLFGVVTDFDGLTVIGRVGAVFDDIYFTAAEVAMAPANTLAVPEPGGLTAILAAASCLAPLARRRSTNYSASPSRCGEIPRHALQNSTALGCAMLLVLAVSAIARAQAVFSLGTFSVDTDPTTGAIPLPIPAGTFNSYRLTTDWSAETPPPNDPHSREAIWSLADGHLNAPSTTVYANPGSAPNSADNGDPVTLEWDGFLDLPVTGPLDLSFLNVQVFAGSEGKWANTILELSFESPPPPPALNADLGVVANQFSPFNLVTSGDFDTELAVYSSTGAMLRRNDDAPGAVLYSQIDFDFGLPSGDYVAVLGGFNTSFDDGYAVTPGAAAGKYGINIAGADVRGTLAADQLAYVGFRVVPEPYSLALVALGLLSSPLLQRGKR